jgi:ferredoxin
VKVEILRDKCVGSGNCVELAKWVFAQDDEDGKVLLVAGSDIPDSDAVMEAALICPVGAIMINGKLV